jgi:hypothetical protein
LIIRLYILISKDINGYYWFDLTTNWRFNGISVETVIRTIKTLEKRGIKIINRKYIANCELMTYVK